MLLVLRAQPAVKRTAILDLGLEPQRQRPWLVVAELAHVQLRVGVDERLELAMLAASLAHDHPVVTDVQLGVDHRLAHRADGLRELEEHIVSVGLLLLDFRHYAPRRATSQSRSRAYRCSSRPFAQHRRGPARPRRTTRT